MSDVSKSVENAIEFYYVESLQNMAAIKVVIRLWYHPSMQKIIELHFKKYDEAHQDGAYNFRLWSEEIKEPMKDLAKELKLPDLIKNLISSFVPFSWKHLVDWLQDTDIFVFDLIREDKHLAYKYMNDIHWSSDGSVDRLETAEAMLRNANLSDFHKFRVMSMHCMVNRLNEISPREFRQRYFQDVPFYKHPLQYYWNCFLNHDYLEYEELFDLIQEANDPCMSNWTDWQFARRCRLNCTCEFYLLNCFLPNIQAALYFWKQLQECEKVNVMVKSSIDFWFSSEIVWGLMSTLKPDQLRQVLDQVLPYIVKNLSCDLPYQNRALSLALLSTPQQFADIVKMIILARQGERIQFFSKLWKLASTVQRSYMFNSNTDWVFFLLCNPHFGECLDEMIFVFTHKIDYERIKIIFFGIDWNRDELMDAKERSVSQFREFFDRILVPEDAVIIKERI